MSTLHVFNANACAATKWYPFKELGLTIDGVFKGTGVHTALFGMMKDVAKDDDVIWCFDSRKNSRREEFSEYKANRKGMGSEYNAQITEVQKMLIAAGFTVLAIDGYEADDLVGYVVEKNYNNDKYDKIIIRDNDEDQLAYVRGKVTFLSVRSKSEEITERNFEVCSKMPYGCVRLYKAIVGCTSDNVPGIQGRGPAFFFKFYDSLKADGVDVYNISKDNREEEVIKGSSMLSDAEKEQALYSLKQVLPMEIPDYIPFEAKAFDKEYMNDILDSLLMVKTKTYFNK